MLQGIYGANRATIRNRFKKKKMSRKEKYCCPCLQINQSWEPGSGYKIKRKIDSNNNNKKQLIYASKQNL